MNHLYPLVRRSFLSVLLFITLQISVKAQTTLVAGDIAFTGYISNTTTAATQDGFSFVLLTNVTANTVINFTENGWLSTNVFRTGENTVTWTAATALNAGTEIRILGTTATMIGPGNPGTVTGTPLSLSNNGDQVLAYQGSVASPTFISAIHMNVYNAPDGDPSTTTDAAWDGTANTTSSSALPPGLTSGVNAIWIGTQGVLASEFDNSRFTGCALNLSTAANVRAAVNNKANWTSNNDLDPTFTLPTGCSFITAVPAPTVSNPANTSVCDGQGASFTATATNATSYQWQVDNGGGGGFVNITNDATYSGATTLTLNIAATTLSLNGYQYRIIATNGSGSATSNAATLTVTALPTAPSLLLRTPGTATVADGTNVSATFNAGSGGTGCSDDFRYTTNGGASYLPYTPGSNISTTGVAAGSGMVFIEGRRANCSAGCQGNYVVLASWVVTPLPAAATTLAAGDIAFSSYTSTSAADDFSFVLLRNIGAGTVINFTENGWLSTNVFRTGENTVTWTSNAAYPAGTEIRISGLTSALVSGSSAGSVTGTPLALANNGDQILAYQGSAASPTFISGIHMNVYDVANGDPTTTTAAAWDGSANSTNASALPPGLTTGVNAIWIGTQGVPSSEADNARFGVCNLPAVAGSISALRAALNNQANWTKDNTTPPAFAVPTACNYLGALAPVLTVNATLTPFTSCAGSASAQQSFTVTGSNLTGNIVITAPAGYEVSTTSGSGFAGSVTLTPVSGNVTTTTIYVRITSSATGTPAGNITVATPGVTTANVAVTGTVNNPPTTSDAGPDQAICTGLGTVTMAANTPTSGTGAWTQTAGPITATIVDPSSPTTAINGLTTAGTYTFTWTISNAPCPASANTVDIVVSATPTVIATPSSQSICSGANITTIVLSGTGASYNWTRDNAGITGIAMSGSGNISGALTNTGNAPVTVTFTITATTGSCTSAPISATVVVNPIPNVVANPTSLSICTGGTANITFTGNVSGTSFDWTRDNTGVVTGSVPASGSGNVSGNLINNTAAPVTTTFTITPTANGCPGTPITVIVTVNPAPNTTITGGGVTVCQGTTVNLSGPDPTYNYVWGRSLFAAPFTTIGTAQTQPVTTSGNYQMSVQNTYGCIASATTTVNVADYVFNGSIAAGDPTQTGRLNRFATISTCGAPKGCPGAFTTTGARRYDAYTVTNIRSTAVCATVGINSACSTNIFVAAYSGSFDPVNLCNNYLGDPGSSFVTSGFFEINIPAGGSVVLVVHEVNPNTGCGSYSLTVDVPRETEAITVTPGNTICNGGSATLTASTANSYLWTPGGQTTKSIVTSTGGTFGVTLGYGNNGCTATPAAQTITIQNPVVDPVPNVAVCNGAATAPIVFTGTAGTTYNWTNNNTTIGLGASGTGDIPTFNATNSTGAAITATITVTPVNGSCTGAPITFTITVAPQPAIISVTEAAVCAPGGVANLGATVANGVVNWYDDPTAGTLLHTGPTFSPTISATTTYYVENTVYQPAPPVQSTTMPAQSSTFPGNTRGYLFTAPSSFVITSLHVPTDASSGNQSIAVVRFNGGVPPPVFSASTNAFTVLYLLQNGPASGSIPVNIQINSGDVIGILASRANINSYGPTGSSMTINGSTVGLTRLGMQFVLSTTAPRDIWQEPGGNISRVNFEYAPSQAVCTSSPRVPVTATLNPLPTVDVVTNKTACNNTTVAAIPFTGTPAGSVSFSWTNDNTAIGLGASGNGNIPSFTATNGTNAPIVANISVTATYTSGGTTCSSAPMTFTITVYPTPNAVATPASQTVCSGPINPIILTGNVSGTTFNWTRDNTGTVTGIAASGSGDITGTLTNTTTAPVTVTFTITPVANGCPGTPITATVVVNASPTIVCPANITRNNDAGVCGATVTYTPTVTGIPAPALTYVFTGATTGSGSGSGSGSVFAVGTTTVQITATNSCNTASCTFTITVIDAENPVITCPAPVTVSCAGAIPAPNTASVTATDNCPGVTVTHVSDVMSAQTCTNRFTVTRTYRATDAAGNSVTCTQIITVNDQTGPVVTCPAPVTVSCASAVPAPNTSLVTATDNCGGTVTITHVGDVISAQTCANRYTITRTYRATDVCGNTTDCTQTITVNDVTPPVVTCPAPVTVSCASAVPAPNTTLVTATDNCGGAITITHVGDVISAQTCANRYTITRTYRATDVCGNFADCTQTITVNDVTPPVITCPAAVTVSCASAVPAPSIASVTATDNCGGAITIVHVGDVISGQTCANRFTITRTYRATDVCGNSATCTQTITVNDVTPPVITCPAAVTVSCASAVPAPNIASVTATDNCGGAITIVHVGDVISAQTCTNRFTVTRTYRATDVCGNSSTCTQIITVNDQTAPVITCPANITATTPIGSCTAVVNFTVTATDNCGGPVTITSSPASGTAFPIGTTTVTSTAVDACGNTSTCTFTVTVNDGQLPVITTQPANRTVCLLGNATFSVTATNAVTYQWQRWNGTAWVDIAGATASTYTVNGVTLFMNTNTFRVRVIGLCTTITSNPATLFVNPLPSISLTTSRPPLLLPGQFLSITATVNPTGGTFVWRKNGTIIPGATTNVLANLGVDDQGLYTVTYTDLNGCVSVSAELVIGVQISGYVFIYPNPNNGVFKVRFYNTPGEPATVKVMDIRGTIVYQRTVTTGASYTEITVDLGGRVTAGLYVVNVYNSANQLIGTKPIVVYHH